MFQLEDKTATANQENHLYQQMFVLQTSQTYLNSDIFLQNKTKVVSCQIRTKP